MAGLLDRKEREPLYKAEIRSSLEYSCLAWGGAAPSNPAVLDKIERRAERQISEGLPEQQAASLHSLHSLQHVTTVRYLISQMTSCAVMFSPRTKACEPTPQTQTTWVCLRANTYDRHSAPLISSLISLAEFKSLFLYS
ncbi:hypothetical protein E2C01_087176 [Portunus trituberculatus]|uniref:Uncharacterized protein n=1 Tax=Portunus trituberculatus TaxID=210409 RepID=A0A5B7JBQ4_PORTR|nr:hypothetical protein [Portunus trituberculatus]